VGARCLLVALGLAACGGGAGDLHPRPNVLLITLDSVRADLLHFDGQVVAPNLARLAERGIATEARATTSWTLPSHVALFTGQPDLVHGVEQDGFAIPPGLTTLPEKLKALGYRTFGVYSGPYLDPRHGFDRGFDAYVPGYGPELAEAARAAAEALARVHDARTPAEAYERLEANAAAAGALEVASHGDRSSAVVSDLVIEELQRAAQGTRPFFVFAHYFDTHYDYDPPSPYDTRFDPDYEGSIDGKRYGYRLSQPLPSPRDLHHLKALQAGELAWTDSQIGRVLDTLGELGLAENTVVIVTADHGEEFGEHGGLGHRRTLYEEALRVPLIVRGPHAVPAGLDGLALYRLSDLVLGEQASGIPGTLSRLVLNPTGDRKDVRILEAWRLDSIKVLREASPRERDHPTLRWIDLARHPEERPEDWTERVDLPGDALESYRAFLRLVQRNRQDPPRAPSTDDLLGAFRALGYAGEARVGALDPRELVLAPLPAPEPR
jgi:hypothetical protein